MQPLLENHRAVQLPLILKPTPVRRRTMTDVLHHDVLDVVVHFVFLDNQQELLNLSQVSKRLYFACIPWIYRNATIDFSDRVSLPLLRRLSNVLSTLPTFVRTVTLEHCDQATIAEWILLDKAISRFTRLQGFSWDDHANLPRFVLNSIHHHHPTAMVQIKITQVYAGKFADKLVHGKNFFTNPILSQLASFDFSAKSNEYFYDNFKRDLVELLSRTPNLKLLRIYRGPMEDDGRKYFAEMLSSFETTRLPRLQALCLATRSVIFTRRELEAWGSRDGWSDLHSLALSRPTDLLPFISRVPQLTYLDILSDQGEGMAELSKFISPYTGNPLGPVSTLVYSHFIGARETSNAILMHSMPWTVLDKVATTLTKYVCRHQPYEVFFPGFATPTIADLQRFQSHYPGVTDLTLDIRMTQNRWPSEYLEQLAAFKNLESLMLYVHRPSLHIAYRHLFRYMLYYDTTIKPITEVELMEGFQLITSNQATSKPEQAPKVRFKHVRDFKDMEGHFHIPDFTFQLESTGQTRYHKRNANKNEMGSSLRKHYASWPTRALREKEQSLRTMRATSHRFRRSHRTRQLDDDWGNIIIEITRREKHARLDKLFGDDSVTLYDRWTCTVKRSNREK